MWFQLSQEVHFTNETARMNERDARCDGEWWWREADSKWRVALASPHSDRHIIISVLLPLSFVFDFK